MSLDSPGQYKGKDANNFILRLLANVIGKNKYTLSPWYAADPGVGNLGVQRVSRENVYLFIIRSLAHNTAIAQSMC